MSSDAGQLVSSLYVHVPFCAQKCNYCAFFSEASSGELIRRYVDALIRDLERVAGDLRLRTVFFGGGTPSILSLRQWEMILSAFDRLGLQGAAEWTVECNPATVSLDKARLWRERGINRVSMGVQSLEETLLDRLGRVHSRDMVFRSFDIFREAGFDNINIDLMFAIPGQTMEMWQRTLAEAAQMGSEHLSSYEVIYEEDTALYQQLKAGEFDVDEDLACDMYRRLVDESGAAGYAQYEVANFARDRSAVPGEFPTQACMHNVNYWRGGDFHGLGPSATGYVRGERTRNVPNTRMYCERVEGGSPAVESAEKLSPLARAGEAAAFGLRTRAGWPFDAFRALTGFDLREGWDAEMRELVGLGWAERTAARFCLNAEGLRFADAAAEKMLR